MNRQMTNPLRKGFLVEIYNNENSLVEVMHFNTRVEVKRFVHNHDLIMNGHLIAARWYGSDINTNQRQYIDLCEMDRYAEVIELGA